MAPDERRNLQLDVERLNLMIERMEVALESAQDLKRTDEDFKRMVLSEMQAIRVLLERHLGNGASKKKTPAMVGA